MSKIILFISCTILVLTASSVVSISQVAGVSKLPKLEMKLYPTIQKQDQSESSQKEIGHNAEIRNIGKIAVVIPTKALGPAALGEGGVGVIEVRFHTMRHTTRDGFRIVFPPSDLGLVELRPGEAAILRFSIPQPAHPRC